MNNKLNGLALAITPLNAKHPAYVYVCIIYSLFTGPFSSCVGGYCWADGELLSPVLQKEKQKCLQQMPFGLTAHGESSAQVTTAAAIR